MVGKTCSRGAESPGNLSSSCSSGYVVVAMIQRGYQRALLFACQVPKECCSRHGKRFPDRFVGNRPPGGYLNFAGLFQVSEEVLEVPLGKRDNVVPLPTLSVDRGFQSEKDG